MYASFMGPFVYVLFGSVPALTDGPTTLMALMVQKYAVIHPGYAPFLALCNGVVILTLGILRLGKILNCLVA
jgi:MFS superfamily sulfate permease-like transporter